MTRIKHLAFLFLSFASLLFTELKAEQLHPLIVIANHNADKENLFPVVKQQVQAGREVHLFTAPLGSNNSLKEMDSSKLTIYEFVPHPEFIQKELSDHGSLTLLTGVATKEQLELIRIFSGEPGVKVVAYHDNFSPTGPTEYFSYAQKSARAAANLLCSSRYVYESYPSIEGHLSKLVGSPGFEEKIKSIGSLSLETALSESGLDLSRRIDCYIGGVGEKQERAFESFIQAYCTHIADLDLSEEVPILLIRQHPSSNGFEYQALEEVMKPYSVEVQRRLKESLRITQRGTSDQTLRLCMATPKHPPGRVYMYQSSLEMITLALGIELVYFIPDELSYPSPIVDEGPGSVARSRSNLVEVFLVPPERHMDYVDYVERIVPKGALEKIKSFIEEQ